MKNIVLSILITICIVTLFYFINLSFTDSYKTQLTKQSEIYKSQQTSLDTKIKSLESTLANALQENANLQAKLDQSTSSPQTDAQIWALHEEIRNLKLENKNLKDELKSIKFDERKFQNKNLKIEIN